MLQMFTDMGFKAKDEIVTWSDISTEHLTMQLLLNQYLPTSLIEMQQKTILVSEIMPIPYIF